MCKDENGLVVWVIIEVLLDGSSVFELWNDYNCCCCWETGTEKIKKDQDLGQSNDKSGPKIFYYLRLIYKFIINICANIGSCKEEKSSYICSNVTLILLIKYIYLKIIMTTIQQISLWYKLLNFLH